MNKIFVIMYEDHDHGSSSFVDDGIEVADAGESISICPLKELLHSPLVFSIHTWIENRYTVSQNGNNEACKLLGRKWLNSLAGLCYSIMNM